LSPPAALADTPKLRRLAGVSLPTRGDNRPTVQQQPVHRGQPVIELPQLASPARLAAKHPLTIDKNTRRITITTVLDIY
jgi:hypothetical protein